jgi:hypothetical protein
MLGLKGELSHSHRHVYRAIEQGLFLRRHLHSKLNPGFDKLTGLHSTFFSSFNPCAWTCLNVGSACGHFDGLHSEGTTNYMRLSMFSPRESRYGIF